MRHITKIIATVGPAADDAHAHARLIEAGVGVVRLNFLITKGGQRGIHGGRNLMKILQVGDPHMGPQDIH